jgi:hypothetical protein
MAPKPKKSKSKRKKRKPKTETIKQTQKVTQTVTIILPEKSKRKRKRTAKKSAVQVQQRSTYPVVQFQPQQPFQQPPKPPLDRLNPIAINHRANLPAGIFNRPVQAQRQPFREMDAMSELTDEFQPIGQYVGETPSFTDSFISDFQPGDDRSLSIREQESQEGLAGGFFQPGDDRSLSIREQESQEGLAGGFFQAGDDLSRDSLAGSEPSIASTISLTESGFVRPPRQRRSDAGYPRPHVVERNRERKEMEQEDPLRMKSLRELEDIKSMVDSGSESGSAI